MPEENPRSVIMDRSCLPLRLVLLAFLLHGAFPHTSQAQAVRDRTTKREVLANATPSTPAAASWPAMSRDFLTALETLGVRPGMTLTQARAVAAQWGAALEKEDQRHLSVTARPSAANPYNHSHIVDTFTYRAVPDGGYRGHPRTFNPETPQVGFPPGSTTVMTFPLDPQGDLDSADNLIVYLVDASVSFTGAQAQQQGATTEARFLADGARLIGRPLQTSRSSNRADCGFAVPDYAQRVTALAGTPAPRDTPHLAAWKRCGAIAYVEFPARGGAVSNYRIWHADVTLAERAFNAFRTYGSQLRAGQ